MSEIFSISSLAICAIDFCRQTGNLPISWEKRIEIIDKFIDGYRDFCEKDILPDDMFVYVLILKNIRNIRACFEAFEKDTAYSFACAWLKEHCETNKKYRDLKIMTAVQKENEIFLQFFELFLDFFQKYAKNIEEYQKIFLEIEKNTFCLSAKAINDILQKYKDMT